MHALMRQAHNEKKNSNEKATGATGVSTMSPETPIMTSKVKRTGVNGEDELKSGRMTLH